ncbi:MAG: acyltransferase [Chitinophagales bacterium]
MSNRRVFGLDVLRAAAILFVVLEHSTYLLPEGRRAVPNYFVLDGVTIFFVLSGFLIGGLLIQFLEEGVSCSGLLQFWLRRWFRTLPNYFLILTVTILIGIGLNHNTSITDAWPYYFFLQNLHTPHPALFPEAWSLSVEEWFYLLIPILITACISLFRWSPKKALLVVAVVVLTVATGFRLYRYYHFPVDSFKRWDLIFRKQVITRLDSLMFGVLGAYFKHYHFKIWNQYKLAFLVSGLIILLITKYILPVTQYYNSFYGCVCSFSLMAFGTLLLLPWLSNFQLVKQRLTKWITHISLISYSMYLLNLTIIQNTLMEYFPWEVLQLSNNAIALIKYALFWILVIGLSSLLYRYYERPMTRLRDQIF